MANPNSGPRALPPPDILSSIMASDPIASANIAGRLSQQAAQASQAAAEASAATTAVPLDQATTSTLDTGEPSTSAPATEQTFFPSSAISETGAARVSQQTSSADLASSTSDTANSLTQTGSQSTTLATSASENSAASENASFQASPSPTSLHGPYHSTSTSSSDAAALPPISHAHHSGLNPGAIAAAVVVPLLFLLAALAFAFILLRRRNRRNAQVGSAGFTTAMKQRSPPPPGLPSSGVTVAPVVTNAHNSAYYTGLDTSSSLRSSHNGRPSRLSNGGTTFYEPPPAYKKPSSLTSRGEDASPPSYDGRNLPRLSLPTENGPDGGFDPFDDPASPTSLHSFISGASRTLAPAAVAAAPVSGFPASPTSPRPGTSRSNTNVSITSDLYSDTASVHSARAVRMSVGGAPQVIGANGSRLELGQRHGRTGSDPFRDPVSPL